MRAFGAVAALAALVLVAGCSDEADEPIAPNPAALAESIEIDALTGHLTALQDIADAHDGNRAAGTGGYDASVDYVADQLTDAGFDVQTPEFSYDSYDVRAEQVSVDGNDVPASVVQFSPSTPADGVRGRVLALHGPGCQGSDYDGLDATGAVAVVARGECSFADKQRLAGERGAVAVVVTNVDDRPTGGATLGEKDAGRVPTVLVGRTDGEAAAAAGEIVVLVDASLTTTTTRNVIAQTKTGSTDDVVMVGAHLDSVPAGPGINDNGTGVAAVLETARQLGAAPEVTNAVRFAFWGAEELGLLGSDAYVTGLDRDERLDIALYLNYDMLGSPNFGYFAYDGDDSDHEGEPAGPEGSAGIERTMGSYLLAGGVTPLRDGLRRSLGLRSVHRARNSRRRYRHRRRRPQDRGGSGDVGRHRGGDVRPELPHRPRPPRQRQPGRVRDQRRDRRVRHDHVREIDRGAQRGARARRARTDPGRRRLSGGTA